MDFGDILNKWERGQSASQKKSNLMETWLKEKEVYDKDAESTAGVQAPGETRRRLLREKPDAVLDIHGLTGDNAWLSLDDFFSGAKSSGFEKLRIIHGKGNHSHNEAVLGRIVRDFIEQCPYAGESGHEKAVDGGSGATWVFLK
jgi:DNA-nicking Smr family endonuclease